MTDAVATPTVMPPQTHLILKPEVMTALLNVIPVNALCGVVDSYLARPWSPIARPSPGNPSCETDGNIWSLTTGLVSVDAKTDTYRTLDTKSRTWSVSRPWTCYTIRWWMHCRNGNGTVARITDTQVWIATQPDAASKPCCLTRPHRQGSLCCPHPQSPLLLDRMGRNIHWNSIDQCSGSGRPRFASINEEEWLSPKFEIHEIAPGRYVHVTIPLFDDADVIIDLFTPSVGLGCRRLHQFQGTGRWPVKTDVVRRRCDGELVASVGGNTLYLMRIHWDTPSAHVRGCFAPASLAKWDGMEVFDGKIYVFIRGGDAFEVCFDACDDGSNRLMTLGSMPVPLPLDSMQGSD